MCSECACVVLQGDSQLTSTGGQSTGGGGMGGGGRRGYDQQTGTSGAGMGGAGGQLRQVCFAPALFSFVRGCGPLHDTACSGCNVVASPLWPQRGCWNNNPKP